MALRLDGVTVDREKHERAQRDALGASFVEGCKAFSEAKLSCALASTDSSSLRTCLRSEVTP